MYSIIDVESTGGQHNKEGITEIALYKFDGSQITDQFSTLINPERPIQPFVSRLTGIRKEMLRQAPKFHEIARRIVETTQDTTLVAHNAEFDYRMLRLEFKRLGFDFRRKTLDTVELSRQLIPGMASYSLGKLCKSLGIPLTDRHRAHGDALATLKLFQLLLDKDYKKQIIKASIISDEKSTGLNTRLKALVNPLPHKTGVYYLHDSEGEIIYIGKSLDIKNRIVQHFSGHSKKAERLRRDVASISHEETGSELIALLKESHEIKHNKPLLNRAQRRTRCNYGLYKKKNTAGYCELYIAKIGFQKTPILSFATLKNGVQTLYKIIEKYELCPKHCKLSNTKGSCFRYQIKRCGGACIGKEPPKRYNERISAFIESCSLSQKSLLLIDKGRSLGEKSFVLIEGGSYKGYGFFNLNNQIIKAEILRKIIIPMQDNRDVKNILRHFIQREKIEKIIEVPAEAALQKG